MQTQKVDKKLAKIWREIELFVNIAQTSENENARYAAEVHATCLAYEIEARLKVLMTQRVKNLAKQIRFHKAKVAELESEFNRVFWSDVNYNLRSLHYDKCVEF